MTAWSGTVDECCEGSGRPDVLQLALNFPTFFVAKLVELVRPTFVYSAEQSVFVCAGESGPAASLETRDAPVAEPETPAAAESSPAVEPGAAAEDAAEDAADHGEGGGEEPEEDDAVVDVSKDVN